MVREYDASAVPTAYRFEDAPPSRGDGVVQRFFRGLDTLVGMTRVDPGRVGDRHAHPWEQVVYVLDGTCTFHVGEVSMAVEAGDVFLVPPGFEHAADGGEPSGGDGGAVASSDRRSDGTRRTSSDSRGSSDGGDAPCTLLFCGPLREDALEHTDYQVEFPGVGESG